MKDTDVIGGSETQKQIFKLIYNRARSIDSIATTLDLTSKTIKNNLPNLKDLVDKDERYDFIRNYDKDKNSIFSIVPKKDFTVKLLPKIFKWARSNDHPYMVINLPSPPKGYDKWIIIPIGDIHYGSDVCDNDGLMEWVLWIKDTPNVLTILNGDLIENANKESPGSSVFRQLFPPQEQKERIINILAPIAHKTLYSLKGNHGNRSVKQCFLDPERDISNILNVEYFEGACYADIICEDYKWEVMSIHGTSNSATLGGRLNTLLKKRDFHSADIFTMGHVHDLQSTRDYEIIRDPENLGLKLRKRFYVICGTVQKYFNSYAEEWVLPPNRTGFPRIELFCDGSRKPGDYHVGI